MTGIQILQVIPRLMDVDPPSCLFSPWMMQVELKINAAFILTSSMRMLES